MGPWLVEAEDVGSALEDARTISSLELAGPRVATIWSCRSGT
jgi:hypothetical protein